MGLARKPTKRQVRKNQDNQKIRIKLKKAARRSGKSMKNEGKIDESKSKKNLTMSQKRIATIKKARQ